MGMFVFQESGNNSALLSILKHQTWKACTLITAQQQSKEIQKLSKLEMQKEAWNIYITKKVHKSPTLIQILFIADTYD